MQPVAGASLPGDRKLWAHSAADACAATLLCQRRQALAPIQWHHCLHSLHQKDSYWSTSGCVYALCLAVIAPGSQHRQPGSRGYNLWAGSAADACAATLLCQRRQALAPVLWHHCLQSLKNVDLSCVPLEWIEAVNLQLCMETAQPNHYTWSLSLPLPSSAGALGLGAYSGIFACRAGSKQTYVKRSD